MAAEHDVPVRVRERPDLAEPFRFERGDRRCQLVGDQVLVEPIR
jgi:hypothetical protein